MFTRARIEVFFYTSHSLLKVLLIILPRPSVHSLSPDNEIEKAFRYCRVRVHQPAFVISLHLT